MGSLESIILPWLALSLTRSLETEIIWIQLPVKQNSNSIIEKKYIKKDSSYMVEFETNNLCQI